MFDGHGGREVAKYVSMYLVRPLPLQWSHPLGIVCTVLQLGSWVAAQQAGCYKVCLALQNKLAAEHKA